MSLRAALVSLALAGCATDAEPLTQLALVSDSDLALDTITFEARGADGLLRSASAARGTPGPSFVTLVQEQGPTTGVAITASGRKGDKLVVSRTHVVSFVPDQTRVVPLDLYASCVGVTCPADQTCAGGRCTPQTLSEAELLPWRGTPESPFSDPDAGSGQDAGWLRQCGGPAPVDTSADPMNCGACATKCKAKDRCSLGVCSKP